MRTHTNGSWCILRTSGRSTLPLAESLTKAGLDAWTPAELKRYPGKKAKRPVPVMPTFVFAKAENLWPLVEMAEDPLLKHARFSVMLDPVVYGYPIVEDAALNPLRRQLARVLPSSDVPSFANGDTVRVTEGPYQGCAGSIERSRNGIALVAFGGWHSVEISTFILKPIGAISDSQAQKRTAA